MDCYFLFGGEGPLALDTPKSQKKQNPQKTGRGEMVISRLTRRGEMEISRLTRRGEMEISRLAPPRRGRRRPR